MQPPDYLPLVLSENPQIIYDSNGRIVNNKKIKKPKLSLKELFLLHNNSEGISTDVSHAKLAPNVKQKK